MATVREEAKATSAGEAGAGSGVSGGSASRAAAAAADALGPAALVGSVVTVRTVAGATFEAEVFAYDDVADTVVFQQRLPHTYNKRTIRIIRNSAIESIKFLRKQEGIRVTQKLPSVDMGRLRQREQEALAEAERRISRVGVGVSPLAQKVFDALAKTLPCEWSGSSGTDILVMGAVTIKEPYDPSSCSGGQQAALDRIRTILGKVRRKIAATDGTA